MTGIWMMRLILTATLSLTYGLTVAFGQQQNSESPLETIKKVWLQRQAETRSVRLVVAEQRTIVGLEQMLPPPERTPDNSQSKDESADLRPTTLHETLNVCLDGERASYTHRCLNPPTDLPLSPYIKGTYNGNETIRYSAISRAPHSPYQTGMAEFASRNGPQQPEPPQSVRICFLLFRPLDLAFGGIDLSSCRVLPDRIKTGDASLLVLEVPDGKDPPAQLWIDPAHAYSIARAIYKGDKGTVRRRIDITYKHAKPHDWLPSGWRDVSLTPEGGLVWSDDATVSEITVNQPIPDSEFTVDLPEGTYVTDIRDGKRLRRWIGDPPPALGGGDPAPFGRGDRLSRVVWLNVILVGLVAGFFLWKRFRSYYKGGPLP